MQPKIYRVADGIVKLSEFEQNLGNTRIHNSLIVQHSGTGPRWKISPIWFKLTIPADCMVKGYQVSDVPLPMMGVMKDR